MPGGDCIKLAVQTNNLHATDRMKPKLALIKSSSATVAGVKGLLADVREMILATRQTVATGVNSALVLLYWNIGRRIRVDILKEKRADYGKKIFYALSRKLTAEFGNGFSQANLFHMVRCAEVFPDAKILHSLSANLSWTHFRRIIYLDDPLKRDFYAEMCRVERWSVRTLHEKIQSMLFERTALSKRPAKLAAMELKQLREKDKLNPDLVFRDPYLLDFLRLKDTYVEKDLEAAILREIEAFILELGLGFCFVERQKRMQIDGRDYYLDLLFYHRKLRRLVAMDLKIGDFEAADKELPPSEAVRWPGLSPCIRVKWLAGLLLKANRSNSTLPNPDGSSMPSSPHHGRRPRPCGSPSGLTANW